MTASEDLRAVVAGLHRRLDTWAAAVEGVAGEADDTTEALADPRLEAAEAAFDDLLGDFHSAAGVVLGLPPLTELEDDDEDGPDDEMLVLEGEDFYLHFVVGVPDGASAEALDRALEVVDEAGFEVINRLEEAGFVVPSFGSSRGVPIVLDDDEDNGDDGDGRP